MATLPRYQNLGIQYADLPKISTAAQQAQVQGFEVLNRSLDRMTSYFQGQAETEAKKQAKKYAVENPLTTSQLEAALKDPSTLKIEGAGSIFQETYQAYAASQLSTDLQLQAGTELKSIELDFEAGNIDASSAAQKMRDLLDGQSSVMNIVSPEASIQHRSAVATLAKTSYNKVLDLQQKADFAIESAKLELGLQNLPAQLEDIIKYNANSIDPETGKPVDLQKLMAIQLQPYAESIRKLGGDKSYFEKALKMVDEAKVGALSGYLADRSVSKSASEMSDRFLSGDFGDLTKVYQSLTQDQKDDVYAKAAQSFTTEYTARKNAQSLADDENKVKGKAIALRVLDGNISGNEKRKLVRQMVALDYITFQSGEEMLKPKDPPMNPRLEFDLLRKINRGDLTADELVKESPRLSNSQFVSLGRALLNAEDAEAKRAFKAVAGIIEGQQVIGDSKITIYGLLDRNYMELRKLENPDGTPKYTPAQAREEAIRKYEKDDTAKNKREKRNNAERIIRDELGNVAKDIPIESIDFNHDAVKGVANKAVRDRLIEQQRIYKENL